MTAANPGVAAQSWARLGAPRAVATMWDALLALGALLALETQLRLLGPALGPGEVLLALWMGPVALVELLRFGRFVPRPFWNLVWFWATMILAMSVGVSATVVRAVPDDWSLVIHDVAAYALLATLTLLMAVRPFAFERLHRLLAMVVALGAALLLLQDANAAGLISFSSIDPWYWDRMRGWADNPNQFALLCLLIGFMAVALVDMGRGAALKTLGVVGAAIGLGTGFLAKSNAFPAVVILGFLVMALAKGARALARAERRGVPSFAIVAAAFGAVAFASIVVAPVLGPRIAAMGNLDSLGRTDRSNDDEAALRVTLWTQAVERGSAAYGLGLGPGPHLDIPASILAGRRDAVEPINLSHPKPGLAPNFESHNTFLELFLQGGVMALGAFLWICVTAFSRARRAGFDGLAGMLVAVAAFGSFHVISRHPLVWIGICLALAALPRRVLAVQTPYPAPVAIVAPRRIARLAAIRSRQRRKGRREMPA